MRIAYFDCFSGASGDMILGALLDAGLSLHQLEEELFKLNLSHYQLMAKKVLKNGIAGTQVEILIDETYHRDHPRHLHDIETIINESKLQKSVKQMATEVFQRLAKAEAAVHMTDVGNIHFHEVGAVDAILDVVGAVAGLSLLRVTRVYCSPIHVGAGTVNCQHGTLPVPAPATVELMKGKPIYSIGVVGELLTPTGAAILSTLASDFGCMPAMIPQCAGYGAGKAELPLPNLLRVFIGDIAESVDYETETVAVIETGIDDMNPQIYDYVIEKILKMGAFDVLLKPVQMKKNRPGNLLSVICKPESVTDFAETILRETTTIGLRWRLENRIKAQRKLIEVPTPYGMIRCKVATSGERVVNVSPEYEDCKKAAFEQNVPLKEIADSAKSLCASRFDK
ncbi:MAG: nickel pincer cofactor biosynthesis protein LarC [Desulfoferrobacter sp.]